MDLGVIDGRDMIAVPEPPGGGLDQPGQAGGDVVGVPGAVLGEGFQCLPVSGPLQGQDRLGDGVSSPSMAMAVTHSANRRKLGPVKAQAKADSRACQIDQSRLVGVMGTSPVAVPKGFYTPLGSFRSGDAPHQEDSEI